MAFNPVNPNGQATMANSQPVTIASNQTAVPSFISDPVSLTKASVSASGSLSVGLPATTVFNDSLNGTVIDVTNRWNAPILAGTGTVTQNGTSGLVFTVSTTANNGGQISSQPTFDISGAIQYIFALGVQLETTTIATGNHRFWGLANQGTAYSTTNPIKEGVGFEITTAGVLRAVIYSADAVTFSQALTIPVDGAEHLYGVFFLGNYIFWYVDQFSIPVAVSGLLQPSNTILPIRLHSLNGGSTTVGTPICNAFSMAVVDSTRNGTNITDGTFGWRKATVSANGELSIKATGLPTSLGSQSATTSQPVTLSVESASGSITTQNLVPAGTATANSAVEITLNGASGIAIQVTGTYTGALSLQLTLDGSVWVTVGGTPIINMNTGGLLASITSALQSTFQSEAGGFLKARITALAAVTGTATVTLRSVANPSVLTLDSSLPTGTNTIGAVNIASAQTLATVTTVSTLSNTTQLTPGTAATNLGKARNSAIGATDTGVGLLSLRNDTLTTFGTSGSYNTPIADKYGSLIVKQQNQQKTTYSLAFTVTLATTPTDVFQIIGSASKTVMIQKLNISGSQTTGGQTTVTISKRSAANTGGTSSASTMVPHDSADAAATAVGAIYTANPTPGAAVGSIRIFSLPLAAVTATTNNIVQLDFGERAKPIVLNGVAQAVAINLGGATLTGGVLNIWMEFTEE